MKNNEGDPCGIAPLQQKDRATLVKQQQYIKLEEEMSKVKVPSIVDEMTEWIINDDGVTKSVLSEKRIRRAIEMIVERCAEIGDAHAGYNSHVHGGWGKIGADVARDIRELLTEHEEYVY